MCIWKVSRQLPVSHHDESRGRLLIYRREHRLDDLLMYRNMYILATASVISHNELNKFGMMCAKIPVLFTYSTVSSERICSRSKLRWRRVCMSCKMFWLGSQSFISVVSLYICAKERQRPDKKDRKNWGFFWRVLRSDGGQAAATATCTAVFLFDLLAFS